MKPFTAVATVTADHRLIVPTPPDLPPGTVEVVVAPAPPQPRRAGTVAELGWTREEAAETRGRLASFADDWNAPGMEVYDDVQPR